MRRIHVQEVAVALSGCDGWNDKDSYEGKRQEMFEEIRRRAVCDGDNLTHNLAGRNHFESSFSELSRRSLMHKLLLIIRGE